MLNNTKFDVLVIGSGAAGLTLALRLPESLSIAVVSKRELREGNTYYAQGGISAVLDSHDSVDSHIADTLNAGAGIGDEDIIRQVVEMGPASIEWLFNHGVAFTRYPDEKGPEYHLTREGGHSHRRVVHAADATGMEVETSLEENVRRRANIEVLEHHIAID
ncbi:MAG: FAD-dependent oxidoreductase, partial [bacterium]